jgi:hypothetical protein
VRLLTTEATRVQIPVATRKIILKIYLFEMSKEKTKEKKSFIPNRMVAIIGIISMFFAPTFAKVGKRPSGWESRNR